MPWARVRHTRCWDAAGELPAAPYPEMGGSAARALGVRRESIVVHLPLVRRRTRVPVRACPVCVRSTVPAHGRREPATNHFATLRNRCRGALRTRRCPPLRRPAATAELPGRRHCRNSNYCPLLRDRTPGHSSAIFRTVPHPGVLTAPATSPALSCTPPDRTIDQRTVRRMFWTGVVGACGYYLQPQGRRI